MTRIITSDSDRTSSAFERSETSSSTYALVIPAYNEAPTIREVVQKALCDIARHVNDDVPFLFLCGRKYYLFATTKIKGLPEPDQEAIRLTNVWMAQ